MKVNLEIKSRASLPKIELGKETFETIGEIVQASILRNISSQRTADGSRLRVNKQSTLERKRREGKRLLSLVDSKHRFVKGRGASWKARATRSQVVVAPATSEIAKISGHVQEMGYTGWFAVSKEAAKLIRETVRERLKAIIAAAARRT